MVIADEDITIGAGKLERVRVKEIIVQKDMLALPCAFSHHPIISVVKVATKEEAYWTKVKEETEIQILLLENRLKFEKCVLEMALLKLENESKCTHT